MEAKARKAAEAIAEAEAAELLQREEARQAQLDQLAPPPAPLVKSQSAEVICTEAYVRVGVVFLSRSHVAGCVCVRARSLHVSH